MSALLQRGAAAGLAAGVLAGLFGLVLGSPAIDSLEAAAEARSADSSTVDAHGEDPPVSRTTQRAGLVVATALAGTAAGLVMAVAFAWSQGRMVGDSWRRSLLIGATAVGALVVLPTLAYPAMPPGGDAGTVEARSLLYVATALFGVTLGVAGRQVGRRLDRLSAPARQAIVAGGIVALAWLWLVLLPSTADLGASMPDVPADLVWDYRLSVAATQLLLLGGTAVVFGLMSHAADERARAHASI